MKGGPTRYWDRRVGLDFLASGVGILLFGVVLGWAARPLWRPVEKVSKTTFHVFFLNPERHPEAFKPVYFSLPSLLGWSQPVLNGQLFSPPALLLLKWDKQPEWSAPHFPVSAEPMRLERDPFPIPAPRLAEPPVYRFEGVRGEWRWTAVSPGQELLVPPPEWDRTIPETFPQGETLWLHLEADETGRVIRVLPLPPFDPTTAGPLVSVWRKARLPLGQKTAWIQIARRLEWNASQPEGER